MTGNTLGWVIVAFVLYLLMMIAIGAFYAKGNNNSEDYFLGGRKLNGFVAALSAQASDMSGWLLMGLPGAIYLTGVGGDGWIAIGLFIGTTLNWLFIATKLRRYTIRANNSVTLPTYFENRFHDEKKVLMAVSSITIVVFFLVYCASALSAGGQLFESVFGIDYHVALTIGALVVLVYTFLGGFTAVCVTDFIQGMLMLVGILAVPLFAYHFLTTGGTTLSAGLEASGADSANFLNLMKNGDGSNNIVSVISGLGWGLGYFGMPHILVRFMAVRDEKEMTKSKATAISWVALSLGFAVFIGILGRAYLPELVNGNNEKVFIEMIKKEFDVPVSIESYKSPVVAEALKAGADLVNDVWGLKYDRKVADLIAQYKVPCCLMHNREKAEYNNFLDEFCEDMRGCLAIAKEAGIADDQIILDPGVGFGKNYEHNLTIIHRLERLCDMGYPVLLATSRKSCIGQALDLPTDQRVEGTMVTTVMGVLKGAAFVRVHDVKENLRAIRMTQAILHDGRNG